MSLFLKNYVTFSLGRSWFCIIPFNSYYFQDGVGNSHNCSFDFNHHNHKLYNMDIASEQTKCRKQLEPSCSEAPSFVKPTFVYWKEDLTVVRAVTFHSTIPLM